MVPHTDVVEITRYEHRRMRLFGAQDLRQYRANEVVESRIVLSGRRVTRNPLEHLHHVGWKQRGEGGAIRNVQFVFMVEWIAHGFAPCTVHVLNRMMKNKKTELQRRLSSIALV